MKIYLISITILAIIPCGQSQGFVARHNLPVNQALPSGYVRASQLANADSGAPLTGPTRPLGQLPVAQDVASVGASSNQQPPKDPFKSSQPSSAQGPTKEQVQALITSDQNLPGHFGGESGPVSPVGPVGPVGPIGPVGQTQFAPEPTFVQPQQPQPQVVYVPVPVGVPAGPPATMAPPPANLPSWMTHPLSGNLPWNG